MNMTLYYFSGTGNSLRVAQELQKRLPESDLAPIIPLLDDDRIKTDAKTIGLIFPNFCLTIPIPLHDFLKKVDMTSAQYIFAVCTRGGSQSEAFQFINEKLKRQNKRLGAYMNITMPWNHQLGKENLAGTVSAERRQQLELEMQNKLNLFSTYILTHEEYKEKDTETTLKIPRWVETINSFIPMSFNYESHRYMYQDLIRFYNDSNCTRCGICEKVCLSNKIEIVNEKPVWKNDVKCYACFACINYCPQQAIQIESRFPFYKSYTRVNSRYHHESVNYQAIAKQRRGVNFLP